MFKHTDHWPPHHINTALAPQMAPQADRCRNAGFYMATWAFIERRFANGLHWMPSNSIQTFARLLFVDWNIGQRWRSQRSLFTCLDLLAEALVLLPSRCFLHQRGLTLLKLLTCVFTSRLCNHKFFCLVKNPQETSFFSPHCTQQHTYTSAGWKVFFFFKWIFPYCISVYCPGNFLSLML